MDVGVLSTCGPPQVMPPVDVGGQALVWPFLFTCPGCMYLGVESLGPVLTPLNLLRNEPDCFQNHRTSFHYHHNVGGIQFLRIPVNTYYCLSITAILLGMKWYLIVVSSWNSLMTNAVKACFHVFIIHLCVSE